MIICNVWICKRIDLFWNKHILEPLIFLATSHVFSCLQALYYLKLFHHVSMSKTRIWVITFTTSPSWHQLPLRMNQQSRVTFQIAKLALELTLSEANLAKSYHSHQASRQRVPWTYASHLRLHISASASSGEMPVFRANRRVSTSWYQPTSTVGYQQYLPLPSISRHITGETEMHIQTSPNADPMQCF